MPFGIPGNNPNMPVSAVGFKDVVLDVVELGLFGFVDDHRDLLGFFLFVLPTLPLLCINNLLVLGK